MTRWPTQGQRKQPQVADEFLVSTRHTDDWKRRLKNLGNEGPRGKIILKDKPYLWKPE